MKSYPGILLLAAVVSGIVCADLWHPSILLLFSVAGVCSLGGIFWLYRGSWGAALVLAAALGTVAAIQYTHRVYQFPPSHISQNADPSHPVQVFGVVADWPEIKGERTELIVSVDSLGGTSRTRGSGRLLLRISDTTTALQRGDRVEFYGRIYPVEERSGGGRFDYNRYLNLKGVFGTVYLPGVLDIRVDRRAELGLLSLIDRLRDGIREVLYSNLSPMSAALASGFLIGETREIPVDVYQRFRDSGTLHLMAVSGSNVAVVLLFFHLLQMPFGLSPVKRTALLLAVIVLFAGLSYAEPSVIRASVMAGLVLMAGLLQRRYDLNNVIALAMLLILLVDPAELYDVGFQLSFVTAWGLIFVVPKVTLLFVRWHNRRWYRWVVFPMLVSLVAQLCSAPLILCYFGVVPLVSVAANLIIVPLASLAIVGILVMLVAHLIWPTAGLFVGRLLDWLLQGLLGAVNFFGHQEMPVLRLEYQLDSIWWGVLLVGSLTLVALTAVALQSRWARRLVIGGLLVGANVGLVLAAVNPTEEPVAELWVNSIPGGVVVLNRPLHGEADLIITGLRERSYPIDARILLPWLRSHGATKLRYCIVLASTYHALDDLFRLADSSRVKRLYLAAPLEKMARQVWREQERPDALMDKVRFFGGSGTPAEFAYALARDKLVIRYPAVEVRVGQSAGELLPRPESADNRSVLVIAGQAWPARPSDWIAGHQNGRCEVICPRIAQPPVQSETAPHGVEIQDIPDYIHLLGRTGELHVRLTNPPQISPR